MICKRAYGKLTLSLNVTCRKKGQLQFDNITVPIDLFDVIYLEKSKKNKTKITSSKAYLPNDRRNTVYQALLLMKKEFGIKDHFNVEIVKNIPAQSGLGGGSADAAAVIQIINELYRLHLSNQELIDLAKKIDEDTAFCLFNQTAQVQGHGEKLDFIEHEMQLYYIFIKPRKGTSTKRFMNSFTAFKHHEQSVKGIKTALKKQDIDQLNMNLYNGFYHQAKQRNKYLQKIKKDLRDLGFPKSNMTGSGSGMYALSDSIEEVMKAHQSLVNKYPFVKYGRIL